METEQAEETQATLPLQPPPQPPLPPSQATRSELRVADHLVEQVGKLVASPVSVERDGAGRAAAGGGWRSNNGGCGREMHE